MLPISHPLSLAHRHLCLIEVECFLSHYLNPLVHRHRPEGLPQGYAIYFLPALPRLWRGQMLRRTCHLQKPSLHLPTCRRPCPIPPSFCRRNPFLEFAFLLLDSWKCVRGLHPLLSLARVSRVGHQCLWSLLRASRLIR